MIDALFSATYVWPPPAGQRVLVLGLGGGSDAICAYAIAQALGPDVAYANTKHALDANLERISAHVGRLPVGATIRGKMKIESRLPRGPHGSPLVIACARTDSTEVLAQELAALGFERVIGVDTGGDVLDATPRGNRGRDRRMLEVLRRLDVPTVVSVLAPGADGQQPPDKLAAALLAERTAGRFLGAYSLEPYLPILREHGSHLAADRTPNIICRAFDDPTDPVTIPRGRRPLIPRSWLTSGCAFDLA